MNQTFMKEKPVLPLLLSMSLPMVLSMMVNSLYNIVDSFFVAKISEDAMTALSLVYPVQNFINAVTIGFSIGINAVISFFLGAGENKKANAAATQGLLLSILHGILLSVGGIGIMPAFLRMFTDDLQVVDLGIRYSRIAFSFAVIIAMGMTAEKVFQSVGKMTMTMLSMLCGCISNIILDPLLIFGIGIFPEMGIEGAALATGIGQTISLAIYVVIYFVRPIHVRIGKKYAAFEKNTVLRLYSVGIPATLNLALPSLLVSSLNAILASYSQAYVVVLGVYYKLQTFIYLTANGIVQGLRPLIGYNYGAKEHRRVKGLYMTALFLTAAIMAVGTVLCWLDPNRLIGLFTVNSETIRIGAEALRIISLGFIVSSVSVISSGALEGLGKGGPSLVISLLRYTVVIIPAAFLLSRFLGARGVWHAFWVTELLAAVISWFIYRRAALPEGR
ncbi:MAG: MATE family efflux transporter [Lachnospiraceae bacterium]|nr:MATE family efflux transporter [Lachnospiraceae bacterium]